MDTGRIVAFDLETHLIEPGLLTPRIVCGSEASAESARLLTAAEALESARALLADDTTIIAGANIAFDLAVLAHADGSLLPLIFAAFDVGRIYDVQIAQALHAIAEGNLYADPTTGAPARGRYSLERCTLYVCGRDDAKINDFWRLRYALLESLPIAQWPEDARQYPVDDVENTRAIALAQIAGGGGGVTPGPHRNLEDYAPQTEAAFAMHLGAVWSLRTDPARVAELRDRVTVEHADFVRRFQSAGFFRADGSKDGASVGRAVVRAYGGGDGKCPAGCIGGRVLSPTTKKPVKCKDCAGTGLDVSRAPRTPSGGVSTDRDTLMESGDADLMDLADNAADKILNTYLPFVASGTDRPVDLRPNVLVASGRTSYDGLIQLLPRGGGVRDCFRARGAWSGSPVEYVYCSVDYAALELCTLAQVTYWLFGRSQMMETINATGDPGSLHTALGATLAGVSTEEMQSWKRSTDPVLQRRFKDFRQASKAANFGYPGGMGAAKLVLAKRKRSEGSTTAPDGTIYPGVRFCVLLDGAERCGIEKVTEWKGRDCPPLCRHCIETAERVRSQWFQQWPEIREYFSWVTGRLDDGRGEIPCFASGRVRGGVDFTNAANNGFQALAADGAKHALRLLARECYTDRDSPLYGSRPIIFVHDEILSEIPERRAHDAAHRKAQIMVDAMRVYVPDVTVRAEPALMRYWRKEAEPHYVDADGKTSSLERGGRLVPWDDYQ